jgi:hypothetical protein
LYQPVADETVQLDALATPFCVCIGNAAVAQIDFVDFGDFGLVSLHTEAALKGLAEYFCAQVCRLFSFYHRAEAVEIGCL